MNRSLAAVLQSFCRDRSSALFDDLAKRHASTPRPLRLRRLWVACANGGHPFLRGHTSSVSLKTRG